MMGVEMAGVRLMVGLLVGAVQPARQGSVAWPSVRALTVSGVPAALTGSWLTARLGFYAEPVALTQLLGLALILAMRGTLWQTWGRPRPTRAAA